MRSRLAVIAVLSLSSLLVAQTFSPNVRVRDPGSTDAQTGAEPSIAVGPDDKLYVSVPDARVRLWRSDDAGTNWRFLGRVDGDITGFFGDSDLEFDSLGRLYVNDLLDLSSVISRYSNPGTMTSVTQRDFRTFTQPLQDRQWMATFGENTVYLAFHDVGPENMWVATSFDGGQTFLPALPTITDPVLLAETIPNTNDGRVHVDVRTGAVYVVFVATTPADTASNPPFGPHRRVVLSRSFDSGLTWTNVKIFEGPAGTGMGNIFPAFALDRSGNLYVVVAANLDSNLQLTPTGTTNIFYTRSTDRGSTWSPPVQVNTDTGSHVFPAAVAQCSGAVDIAWYGTSTVGNPNRLPTSATWNVFFAQTLNGTGATPSFVQAQVSDHVIHVGAVSTGGLTGDADRRLLDFFEVDTNSAGMANVIWADTGTTLAGAASPWFAKQTSGNAISNCAPATPATIVSGGGFILVNGNKAHFGMNIFPSGGMNVSPSSDNALSYQDKSQGVIFKATQFTSVNRVGNKATMTGSGVVNGVLPTTFTVEVIDNGNPGRQDSFSIVLGTGYTASGNLAGGNLDVQQP